MKVYVNCAIFFQLKELFSCCDFYRRSVLILMFRKLSWRFIDVFPTNLMLRNAMLNAFRNIPASQDVALDASLAVSINKIFSLARTLIVLGSIEVSLVTA